VRQPNRPGPWQTNRRQFLAQTGGAALGLSSLGSALAASADVLQEYARATRRGDQETRKALTFPGGLGTRTANATREAALALGLDTCARLA